MLDRLRLAGAAHENSPRARLYFKTTKAEALPASAIRSGNEKTIVQIQEELPAIG